MPPTAEGRSGGRKEEGGRGGKREEEEVGGRTRREEGGGIGSNIVKMYGHFRVGKWADGRFC